MTEKTVKDETEANHAEGSAQIRHSKVDAINQRYEDSVLYLGLISIFVGHGSQ